jgi:sugar phosphate isomerase/epimerase
MLQPGLVSITFRHRSRAEVVRLAAANGLEAIEWGGDIHVPHGDTGAAVEASRLCADAAIAVAAYGSYYRFEEAFEPVLDAALALGAPVIRVWAGNASSASTSREARARIVEDARRIGDRARAHGIRVAFEFHRNTLTDTAASALALLEEISHPNVGSLWQPPVGYSYEACLESLKRVSPYLEHLHCFHWGAGGSSDKRPLAEGRAAWRGYLQEAAQPGLMRPVLLEFVRDGSEEQLAEDAATLRGLIAEVTERREAGTAADDDA